MGKLGKGYMGLSVRKMQKAAVAAVGSAVAIAAMSGTLSVRAGDVEAAALSAESCLAGEMQAALLVTVTEISSDKGNLRLQIYGDKPDDFLEKGKKLVRVEVPTQSNDDAEQRACVPLPGPGTYALAVLHDVNANGKADIFSEGFGFSNNPKLGLGKPDYDEVVFTVGPGVSEYKVSLSYLVGGDDKKRAKRRALRRH